jgi:hypothetical protein
MPTVEPGLTVKSLAEVAWLVARVGRRMIEDEAEPSSTALQSFWQSTRRLQRYWDETIEVDLGSPAGRTRFEETATQLFATELLVRVWATILGCIDKRTGRQDLTRIASNSVNGLLQIRHRLLSHLLTQNVPAAWAADLDRVRRRCDRWTDLLIGNLVGQSECFQFAFDPDRARDFAVESLESDSSSHPVELLVAAGVQLSLLGQLPEIPLGSATFERLIQSILGSIPEQAFHRDGSLRSQLLPEPKSPPPPMVDFPNDIPPPGLGLPGHRRRFN